MLSISGKDEAYASSEGILGLNNGFSNLRNLESLKIRVIKIEYLYIHKSIRIHADSSTPSVPG